PALLAGLAQDPGALRPIAVRVVERLGHDERIEARVAALSAAASDVCVAPEGRLPIKPAIDVVARGDPRVRAKVDGRHVEHHRARERATPVVGPYPLAARRLG